MAIARGAGTEILRAHHFEAVSSTAQILIYGTQHHIYTVLSIIVFASSMDTIKQGVDRIIKTLELLQ